MESERKIVIEIVDGKKESESKKTKSDDGTSTLQKTLTKIFHPVQTLEDASVGKNIISMQAYQQAKQQIINTVDYYHNRYFSLKEDYLSETTYNNAKAAIGKAASVLGIVGAGAIAGAKLGPLGSVAGAIIGGAGFVVNEQIQKQKVYSQYYQQLNTLSYETSFARERAGLVNDSKGTDN